MEGLEKRIAGDWFEVKERLRHPDELYEHLCAADHDEAHRARQARFVATAAQELEQAVEGGVFEARRALIGGILNDLSEVEFSSEILGRLDELMCRTVAVELIVALQRALLRGELAFEEGTDDTEPSGSTSKDVENAQITEIIEDIKEILASDPSAKMNAAIKNVLLQVQKYRDEAATFKKLKAQATGYRLEMYTKTFNATFNQIFESIRKNYGAFLEEQEEKRRDAAGSPVSGLDVRPWVRHVTEELEAVSRARSTLALAAEEHSGMRGVLVALARERERFFQGIEKEQEIALAATGGDGEAAARLSRMLSLEIAAWLKKRVV